MDKLFLIVASRDLEREELDLLELYGKVLKYDNCHINIPLFDLIRENDAAYVIFDIRNKEHRIAISKALSYCKNNNSDNSHIIALVHSWEKLDDFIDDARCENCMSSLPPKQLCKSDFDILLLEKKIRQPSMKKNFFRFLSKVFSGFSK